MEDTEEVVVESGLTITDIFKVILRRIWWVLGATVLGIVIAVLIIQLWYNKETQYYTMSYQIVYPDSGSGKYPNGSDLFAEESISLETLTDIKNGMYSQLNPDEFKGVDVSGMTVEDDISISENIVVAADSNIRRTYTITVKSKYFGSDTLAHSFLRAVAEYPIKRVNSIMESKEYGVYLTVFDNATSYEAKINALLSQKSYMEGEYSKLKDYGEVADLGIASLRNIFTSEQQNDIRAHITAEKYVLDTDKYKTEADTQIASLNLQIENNNKIIAQLRDEQRNGNQTLETDPYDERIAALIQQNGELQNRIDTITETIAAIDAYTTEGTAEYEAKQAFDARFNGYRNQLEEAANRLKTESLNVYGANSRVIYSSNRLEKQGGMGWFVSVILGALVGLLLSAIVVCIVDLPKYKRGKLAADNGKDEKDVVMEEVPAEGGKE